MATTHTSQVLIFITFFERTPSCAHIIYIYIYTQNHTRCSFQVYSLHTRVISVYPKHKRLQQHQHIQSSTYLKGGSVNFLSQKHQGKVSRTFQSQNMAPNTSLITGSLKSEMVWLDMISSWWKGIGSFHQLVFQSYFSEAISSAQRHQRKSMKTNDN